MAIDTARVKLELASGRSEITAPFHNTAQLRRSTEEEQSAESAPPIDAPIVVDVPLADASSVRDETSSEVTEPQRTEITRPSWIALIAAIVAVGVAVWWVMFQRLPQIDPTEVIERNLSAAQQAMAEGHYTDPAERSAFHYYNAVLALDPQNVEAIAGLDDIADRHLTAARLLLADQRIAEAGVALEKARRVRPDHEGLAAVDTQWRAELKKLIASANATHAKPNDDLAKQTLSKASTNAARPRPTTATPAQETQSGSNAVPSSREATNTVAMRPVIEPPAIAASSGSAAPPAINYPPATETASAPVIDHDTSHETVGQGSNIDAPAVASAAPSETPPAPTAESVEPKLIKMVQPEYPQEALMRGIEGWVDVSLRVTAAGDVVAPRVEGTNRGRMFNRAALSAVEQWKYQPRAEGSAETTVRVRLQFRHQK